MIGTPSFAGDPTYGAPVPDPTKISSTFGPRWKTSANRDDFHPGIDYFDVLDTPVYAIGDGVVSGVYPDGSTQYPNGGNVIVVRHTLASPRVFHGQQVTRFYAVYLHLSSIGVADDANVTRGQTIGTMGSTGDTTFVHLHFETRVQTTCSLPFQTANPGATCATGFDPHVHPYLFVGGANVDEFSVTEIAATNLTLRYVATRGDLDLDVIASDHGAIGFNTRQGMDATSLATLDNFDYGYLRIRPEPFSSTSTEIAYDLEFREPTTFVELRDIHGHGARFGNQDVAARADH